MRPLQPAAPIPTALADARYIREESMEQCGRAAVAAWVTWLIAAVAAAVTQ